MKKKESSGRKIGGVKGRGVFTRLTAKYLCKSLDQILTIVCMLSTMLTN